MSELGRRRHRYNKFYIQIVQKSNRVINSEKLYPLNK